MVMLKVTNIYSFIKDDKYIFFINEGAANILLKLNYLQSRVDTIQKMIFLTPSNIYKDILLTKLTTLSTRRAFSQQRTLSVNSRV